MTPAFHHGIRALASTGGARRSRILAGTYPAAGNRLVFGDAPLDAPVGSM